jgi:hypothetical protein
VERLPRPSQGGVLLRERAQDAALTPDAARGQPSPRRERHVATHRQSFRQAIDASRAHIAPACPPSTPSPRASACGETSCWPTSTEPTTNGYAEGVINKVKVIKRRAYGIPTFTAFLPRPTAQAIRCPRNRGTPRIGEHPLFNRRRWATFDRP